MQSQQRVNRLPTWIGGALLLGAVTLIYSLVLILVYPEIGSMAAALSVVPIGVAGWLYRRTGGLIASLVSIPAHVMLFTLAGDDGAHVVIATWPGSALGVVFGLVIGWLSGFLAQAQARARDLERERAALRAEIAERTRVEQLLEIERAAAQSASRSKSAFVANMSHELRTPLTSIIGYCDLIVLMAQRPSYNSLAADLEQIRAAGQHLLAMVNDLLDLSKIEAGKMLVSREVFGLAGFAAEIAAALQPLMAQNANTLVLNVADDAGTLESDRTKVRQVLFNLLSNAAKFTSSGTVTLTIARVPGDGQLTDWIHLVVNDTGVGIAAEELAGLFEPFTQANAEIARSHGGTGLGLALCQRYCQLLGGEIGVESSVGVGSTFTVRLPATPPAPEQ